MHKIRMFLEDILEKRSSPLAWMVGFLGVVMVRIFLDKFIARSNSSLFDLVMDIHNVFFFFLSFLLVWMVMSLLWKRKPFQLAQLMLWSTLFIIFPPILDLIKTQGEVFWSFYLISSPPELFQQGITFFGSLPSGIVYFGTKITFVGAIILLAILTFAKTKQVLKSLAVALFSYLVFFFMAAFPSFLAYLGIYLQKGHFSSIKSFEIIQWFSASQVFGLKLRDVTYSLPYHLNVVYFLLIVAILMIFFFASEKEKFLALLKNFRYPQIIYHSGLFILGAFLGFLVYPENLILNFFSGLSFLALLVAIWLSWKASVVTNDIYDFEIDKITNSKRPLPQKVLTKNNYRQIGVIVFILAIILGFSLHYKLGWLLVMYQVLAWFYSASPFRLKRFPLISTLVSSLASLVILMLGFVLFSPEQDLAGFPWRVFFLLLISYTMCLPVKDFKDIEGDKKYGVRTIPVIFGEEKTRTMVGSAFFLSYVLSVFFLNEWGLLWWSLLFGSIAFWLLNNKKIAYSRLVWWNLGLVFLYGLILIKVVFF